MLTTATITSKRQLTIPKAILSRLGLKSNSKVVLEEVEKGLLLKPTVALIDDLAGSVEVSKKLQGISADEAITKAKKERFKA